MSFGRDSGLSGIPKMEPATAAAVDAISDDAGPSEGGPPPPGACPATAAPPACPAAHAFQRVSGVVSSGILWRHLMRQEGSAVISGGEVAPWLWLSKLRN